jgi:hypothetical protein
MADLECPLQLVREYVKIVDPCASGYAKQKWDVGAVEFQARPMNAILRESGRIDEIIKRPRPGSVPRIHHYGPDGVLGKCRGVRRNKKTLLVPLDVCLHPQTRQ